MMAMKPNYCVYTVLIGDYEQLNEQPIRKDSSIDFFCFTDNRTLVSESWNIIYIDPIFPMDSVRSARLVKICPHRFLKAYDESLYIDNSMVLKQTPEEIYGELMQDGNTDLVVLNHNYRKTVLDEFAAVIQLQYDNLNTILEQLNAYSLVCPDVLDETPIQSGFLFRKHNDDNVIVTMEDWLGQVFRYSRRDQLSVNYCLRKSNLRVRKIDCDVFNSKYFRYPVGGGRDPERTKRIGALSTISSYLIKTQQMAEIERLKSKLKEYLDQEKTMQALTAQVAEIVNSKTWKIALIFHRIRVRIAPPNSRRARGFQRLYKLLVFPIININRNRKLEIDMALVRTSGLFDENWYLSNNPDVVAAKIDPVRHYLLFGGFEGRDPGPQFSSSWYLATYDDVRKAGINPLYHYLKSGKKEGRATQTIHIVQMLSKQLPKNEQPVYLYLDLMKKCLTDIIYADAQEQPNLLAQPFDESQRMEGLDWPAYAHTMIGKKRLDNIQFCVEDIIQRQIPGDLIETGVWRGGATIFMRAILKAYNIMDRNVWVADSFEGLPHPNPEDYPADAGDRLNEFKELAVSMEQVQFNFAKYGLLDQQVKFLKGWFRDTLPAAPIEKIAVLRLDGDMYESTMDALNALYPKLGIGGYLIVDDYGAIPSCKKAINDYREKHQILDEIIPIDWTGIFWKKGH